MCLTRLTLTVQLNKETYQLPVIFLLSLPTTTTDLTLRLALSITVINKACVVSRSAAWAPQISSFSSAMSCFYRSTMQAVFCCN